MTNATPGTATTPPAVRPLRPEDPRRVGPYPITGLLAIGTKGPVYLGEGGAGPVAVQLLDGGWIERSGGAAALDRALMTARRIRPVDGAAAVLDARTSGAERYVVSEFVPGPSVRDLVERGGPLPGDDVTEVAAVTVTALAAVHDAGLAHGDVGPGAVLLGPDGPRLVGTGLWPARSGPAERPGPRDGSVLPVRGPSTRSAQQADLRAWAATIAYAASARASLLDLTGAGAGGPGTAVRPADPLAQEVLEGLPAQLARIVCACLAPDPAHRPTARHVLELLRPEAVAQRQPVTAELPVLAEALAAPSPVTGTTVTGTTVRTLAARLGEALRPRSVRNRSQRHLAVLVMTALVATAAGTVLGAGAVYAIIKPAQLSGGQGAGDSAAVRPPAGPATAPPSCTAVYRVVQRWPGGFKGEITVVAGDTAVRAWTVRWPLAGGRSPTQWWDASVRSDGRDAVAGNASWNGAVPPGGSRTFGFIGTGTADRTDPPATCHAD